MSVTQVDVVVLTWNDGELLSAAVASALASEGVDVLVTVVDNGSQPPAEVVDEPRVRWLRSEVNLGVARGRNLGIRAGDRELICLLDSDARLYPDTLASLSSELESLPSAGLVGPVFAGQAPESSGGLAPTASRKISRALGRTSAYRTAEEPASDCCWHVDFVIGACQVFRREAYEDVGGIDERWFYGPEDVDFCMRLRLSGWEVLQCRDTTCEHPPRRRNRRIVSRRGLAHASAIAGFLWRHRRYRRLVG